MQRCRRCAHWVSRINFPKNHNQQWGAVNTKVPAWRRGDLENFYSCEKVKLTLEKAGNWAYVIETSLGGSTWEPVAECKANEHSNVALREHPLSQKHARFFRVRFTQVPHGMYLGIVEIAVGGKPAE